MRYCEKCGKPITQGFCFFDGEFYYCSEKCMYQDYTQEEYEELYENDDAYWTTWEEEDKEMSAGYLETCNKVLVFLSECYRFWVGEGKEPRRAVELAIADTDGMTNDPFSPNGKPLDDEAVRITVEEWERQMLLAVNN